MDMIDFTGMPIRNKTYDGANGSKLAVLYDGRQYMLKLPAHAKRNPKLSYSNSAVSEYLGSHIFQSVGIDAQNTLLGTYTYHGTTRVVVACRDFTGPGAVFQNFASLKNAIVDSPSNGYGTELSDILDTIQSQRAVDSKTLSDFFWDMFVVDAFIGNWDRHNGNWGFLYDQEKDAMSIAPVFDCGSSLYPQMDDELAKKVLSSKAETNARIYDTPTSAILIDGRRGNYQAILSSHAYPELDAALERIVPRIDMESIERMITEIPVLSDVHKEFLIKILRLRKKILLDSALKSLSK